VICLILATGPIASLVDRLSGVTMPASARMEQVTRADPMDRPLTASAIDTAIIEALRIDRASDEMALATRSRDCHRQLRLKPTLAQLDRCLAFDDAVVVLQDRDPLRDQGPFSELDVTGRQMSAATLLSNDSIAIDGRLDRIRLAVELALAPAAPQQPEANAASAD
jgi:hypothetical protein